MIAELFSAIRSVFGPPPGARADDAECFRARSRMRSRQQQPRDDRDEDRDEDAHRRRKRRLKLELTHPAARRPAGALAYTASTFQSYREAPAAISPRAPECHTLLFDAFDMSASPETFLCEDADGDEAPSGFRAASQSLWRRRASSADRGRAPRLSPKLGADALWAALDAAETLCD